MERSLLVSIRLEHDLQDKPWVLYTEPFQLSPKTPRLLQPAPPCPLQGCSCWHSQAPSLTAARWGHLRTGTARSQHPRPTAPSQQSPEHAEPHPQHKLGPERSSHFPAAALTPCLCHGCCWPGAAGRTPLFMERDPRLRPRAGSRLAYVIGLEVLIL